MNTSTFALSIWMHFGLIMQCHAVTDILPAILDEVRIYQPIILGDMLEMNKMVLVVKNLNYRGYSIGFSLKQLNKYQSCIVFTDDLTKFNWNKTTYATILVISKIESEQDLKEVDVTIGNEVLFLDWDQFKLYESYRINKVHMTRYLGQFQAINEGKTEAKFVPSKDYISNMENRRGDFKGIELIGAVSWLKEDPGNYSQLIHFFPNNDTYDITKLVNNPKFSGQFYDILELKIWKTMESKFNFTSKHILRKDMKIGSPYISSNGTTTIGEGVFQNLVEGSIDFVTGAFTMLPIRLQFVDFLPIIWSAHDAIFVPIEDVSEEIDWNVYFESFTIEVWVAIIIKCIIFTILVSIIEWFHDCKLVSLLLMHCQRKNINIHF